MTYKIQLKVTTEFDSIALLGVRLCVVSLTKLLGDSSIFLIFLWSKTPGCLLTYAIQWGRCITLSC